MTQRRMLDYNQGIKAGFQNILANLAPVETASAAARAYAVGDYLVHQYTLYKVTAAISVGDAIAEGTNVMATTVMAELSSI